MITSSAISPLIKSGVCWAAIVWFFEMPRTVNSSPHILLKNGVFMFAFDGSIKSQEEIHKSVRPVSL